MYVIYYKSLYNVNSTDVPIMDASNRFIICIVDGNDTGWLVELIWRQLRFFFLVQKLTLIQVASVVVALSDISKTCLSFTFCLSTRVYIHFGAGPKPGLIWRVVAVMATGVKS